MARLGQSRTASVAACSHVDNQLTLNVRCLLVYKLPRRKVEEQLLKPEVAHLSNNNHK